jgi:hypothetical protein
MILKPFNTGKRRQINEKLIETLQVVKKPEAKTSFSQILYFEQRKQTERCVLKGR